MHVGYSASVSRDRNLQQIVCSLQRIAYFIVIIGVLIGEYVYIKWNGGFLKEIKNTYVITVTKNIICLTLKRVLMSRSSRTYITEQQFYI